jgi:signal transduction histidine kinase
MRETPMAVADRPSARPSLRRRLLLAVLGYVVLLSALVALQGMLVNERAERMVWQTLLDSELDHIQARAASDPAYRWADTASMALYDSRAPLRMPQELATLAPGLHDDIQVRGQLVVALVRQVDRHRLALTLDLEQFEAREERTNLLVVGSALALLLVLGALVAWGANRAVRPLASMAQAIGALRPDQPGQQLEVPTQATAELQVIGDALNDYLARNDRFVERERRFIDMASHELRTPVAVIAGASDLALRACGDATQVQPLLERIRGAATGVQELIGLLLVLARDPRRLRDAQEVVALEALLPGLVDDHRHLAEGKDLSIALELSSAGEVTGPPQIVRAAIGNLLRNAIENSDRGVVRVRVHAPGTVVIADPGHGMAAEEIGALYSRIARGGGDRGEGGIGLDLVARLCEHLGWRLQIVPGEGGGTVATLRLTAEQAPSSGSEAQARERTPRI